MGMRLPFLSKAPGPTAMTLASLSFSTLDSGRKMPLAVLVSALMRWTRTRSRRGARARMERIEVAYRGFFWLAPALFFLLRVLPVTAGHFAVRHGGAKEKRPSKQSS